ncbi:hypothetical protein KUA24_98 [Vibrio phage HNL01]|nr:hypothetical protein KUA24_98 [Vibrio phage HNL01]
MKNEIVKYMSFRSLYCERLGRLPHKLTCDDKIVQHYKFHQSLIRLRIAFRMHVVKPFIKGVREGMKKVFKMEA